MEPVGSRRTAPALVVGLAAAVALSALGMLLHNRWELPQLGFVSLENGGVVLVHLLLFGLWWLGPWRLTAVTLLFGWALLHLIAGGILSVLPLPLWPFEPEQSWSHYRAHLLYGAAQLPLLALTLRQLAKLRTSG